MLCAMLSLSLLSIAQNETQVLPLLASDRDRLPCSSGLYGDFAYETCAPFCRQQRATHHCPFCKCRRCAFCQASNVVTIRMVAPTRASVSATERAAGGAGGQAPSAATATEGSGARTVSISSESLFVGLLATVPCMPIVLAMVRWMHLAARAELAKLEDLDPNDGLGPV